MKPISNILSFIFIGFFIWIVYLVWMIFYSDGVVNNKPVYIFSAKEFGTEVNYVYYNPEERMIKIEKKMKNIEKS